MAIAQPVPSPVVTSGLFGAASVGVGLRGGLQALQGTEEAVRKIGEARDAAAEAARERAVEARRALEQVERTERAANARATVDSPSLQASAENRALDTAAQTASSDQAPTVDPNLAPTPDAQATGRGGLVDVSI
jgi:membrane protease subunit (stomatin/prohibitin family)